MRVARAHLPRPFPARPHHPHHRQHHCHQHPHSEKARKLPAPRYHRRISLWPHPRLHLHLHLHLHLRLTIDRRERIPCHCVVQPRRRYNVYSDARPEACQTHHHYRHQCQTHRHRLPHRHHHYRHQYHDGNILRLTLFLNLNHHKPVERVPELTSKLHDTIIITMTVARTCDARIQRTQSKQS